MKNTAPAPPIKNTMKRVMSCHLRVFIIYCLLKYIMIFCLINNYNLESHCKLVGEKKDVVSFFSEADLVVIPSRSEGIPNTLFEAWMAKKPVIATNAGGTSEVVDNMKD